MSNAATARTAFAEQAPRKAPNRDAELWIALPKGGKTLGGNDETFLAQAQFYVTDKMPRVDDYRLDDGSDALARTGIRVFELKPGDAVQNVADGLLDAAIVGMDVMKEFNFAGRGVKGRMQVTQLANLDLAPCALAIAVRNGDTAQTAADLNGRKVVTKYPASVENFAKRNRIKFADIIVRNGGIESYGLMIKDSVIADMVESGRSLAANDWRILGMDAGLGAAIAVGAKKFSDLSMSDMAAIPGVIVPSRAVFIRAPRKMSADKEAILSAVGSSFMSASRALGNKPELYNKRVSEQMSYRTGRKPEPIDASTQRVSVDHGCRFT